MQHGLATADEKPMADTDKKIGLEVLTKTHDALIMSLGDEVLREFSEETIALEICKKLEGI